MVDAAALTGNWTLDPAHSRLGFSARHAMVTKVRGNFDSFEGTAYTDATNPGNSHVEVTIQADSINTNNEARDQHLRTNDFLEIEKYPTVTFKSTGVEKLDDEHVRITGDLTIKATTKQVSIDFEFGGVAQDPFGNTRMGFEGSTSINRQDYGVAFNAALETGGVLVSDNVNIDIEISAIKVPDAE
ncbi:YceI family protein [Propionimicrobium sp. PCR01-08-3]|uniref:YceI family protein n=1 Tax=Propionimicrobium sp. PCR01-08-3 TaxID=3052086 RepID=UPI00255CC9CC|nr:YceI family protein [Propionimicrobium sp. PCR01-08-3]WIY82566.1 YceI family protein [Propionimicrobium sp. PCR01-08-3]